MFLAGLFLPVIALPKPAQCDHGYQTQALPVAELCLQAPAVTVPHGILIFCQHGDFSESDFSFTAEQK